MTIYNEVDWKDAEPELAAEAVAETKRLVWHLTRDHHQSTWMELDAAPLRDKVRYAASIVARSELGVYGVSSPRFVFRYAPSNGDAIGLINLRRIEHFKNILTMSHTGGYLPFHENAYDPNWKSVNADELFKPGNRISVADCFLLPPRRYVATDQNDYFINKCSLGQLFGETDPEHKLAEGTPYVRTLPIAVGVCAQACCFVSTLLLDRYATHLYGPGEITAILSNRHSAKLQVGGLGWEQILAYFEMVGLRGVWQGNSIQTISGQPQGPCDAVDNEFDESINAYITSKMPVIACVDSVMLPSKDRIETNHVEREHHAITIVGCKKWVRLQSGIEPGIAPGSAFLYHDSSLMPFTEISCEQLLRCGYSSELTQHNGANKYPVLIAVTPRQVRIPLMRWKMKEGDYPRIGLVSATKSPLFKDTGLVSGKRVFLLSQLKSELRLRLLEAVPREVQDEVGDQLDEMVTETTERFGWNPDGSHWGWFEIALAKRNTWSIRLWDAEADPKLLASKAEVILKGVLSKATGDHTIRWNWDPIPSAFFQYSKKSGRKQPNTTCDSKTEYKPLKTKYLKAAFVSSFDFPEPFERIREIAPAANIQFYACMHDQLREFYRDEFAIYPSALRIFSEFENGGHADERANDLANKITLKAKGQRVIGFSTYFPEIMSADETVAFWAASALKFLVRTAHHIRQRRENQFIIDLSAGSRAQGLASHPVDSSGAQYSVILTPATRCENAIAELLRRLELIANEAQVRRNILFALELEPGPIFLLNGAKAIDLLCRAIDRSKSDSLKEVVGLNLNIGVHGRICGSKWRIPAAGRRVRYAWRPAATRAGCSKLVAAARLPVAGMLRRLRRQLVTGCQRRYQRRNQLTQRLLHSNDFEMDPQILL